MRILFFSLFLTLKALSAKENIDRSVLLEATSTPVSKIFQGVNVISGEFVHYQSIGTTSGPDAYTIWTTYSSSNIDSGIINDGWNFGHPSELALYMPRGIPKSLPGACIEKGLNQNAKVYYREAGGGLVRFMGTTSGHLFSPILEGAGYSIGGLGAGTSSLYNVHIQMMPRANQFIVTLGDGTKRTYVAFNRPKRFEYTEFPDPPLTYLSYQIKEERLPSGRKRIYTYSGSKLTRIDTLSRDKTMTLNSVSFKENSKHAMVITTSDDQTVTIPSTVKSKKNKNRVVTGIYPYGSDPIFFQYQIKNPRQIPRVERTTRSNGDQQIISYYGTRVKTITNKVAEGTDQKSNFFYDQVARSTTVVTALGKHIFRWNSDQRVTWTETRTLDDQLVQKKRFYWNKKGFLTQQVIYDEFHSPTVARSYRYDGKGNLLVETLFGFWSGKHSPPLKFGSKTPTHCDCYTISRSYSDDEFNLLTREVDSDGLFTEYRYLEGTNLVIAQYEGMDNKIFKRTFWDYNTVVPVAIQTDNGSSRARQHTTDVTYCIIKQIVPRMQKPQFGEPLEERQYSVVDGKEFLINGTNYYRNAQGQVIKQEELGHNERVTSSQSFEYDKWGRVIASIDATGNRITTTYDSLGRVATKSGPLRGQAISYKYDFSGQVLSEEEYGANGSCIIRNYQYDDYGRVSCTTDFRGTKKEHD